MKKFLLFFILINFVVSQITYTNAKISKKNRISAITYGLNGGRFGDNLLSYCRTKWLADKYDIPFIYKKFQYSHNLVLHKKEEKYTKQTASLFKKIHYLGGNKDCNLQSAEGVLYVKKWDYVVNIDWKDRGFVKKLRELIKPALTLASVTLPKDYITVAVHVRRGGGYRIDTKQLIKRQPLRFASDQFYIDQIKRIASLFKEKKLYVHIFTDDRKPKLIVEKFKRALKLDTIKYGYRKSKNNPYCHVLEDFFAMMKFDCLIRPNSHYSQFVERLGNNKIIISPVHVTEKNGKKIIDIIRIREFIDGSWKIKKIKV